MIGTLPLGQKRTKVVIFSTDDRRVVVESSLLVTVSNFRWSRVEVPGQDTSGDFPDREEVSIFRLIQVRA